MRQGKLRTKEREAADEGAGAEGDVRWRRPFVAREEASRLGAGAALEERVGGRPDTEQRWRGIDNRTVADVF